AATTRYFALPHEKRMELRIDERFRRGFMPQGINQHPGYKPDIKESFEHALDLPLEDPDVVAGRPLHGPNRWPADMPGLRSAASSCASATANGSARPGSTTPSSSTSATCSRSGPTTVTSPTSTAS